MCLLCLDEYWQNHPELHDIPIYYASSLAKKCMAVYQTYVNAMNDKIRKAININNPFVFKHISNLKVKAATCADAQTVAHCKIDFTNVFLKQYVSHMYRHAVVFVPFLSYNIQQNISYSRKLKASRRL